MFITKNSFVTITLFLIAISCFSQEAEKAKYSFVPTSIYASLKFDPDINGNYNLNKKLNLKSYKFAILDARSIEDGYFTIPFQNFNKVLTNYIFDTYQDIYHNQNLKKSFFKLADLYNVPNRK